MCGELKAESAVIEILGWKQAKLTFKDTGKKKFRKQIQLNLIQLLEEVNKPKADVLGLKTEVINEHIITLPPEIPAQSLVEIDETIIIEARVKTETMAIRIRELALAEILKPLQETDGYLASAIFDMSGSVLIKHNVSTYSVEAIGESAVIAIKSASNTITNIGLGECNFMQINCENSIFEVVWVLEDQFFAILLLNPTAKNTGLAKMRLTKVCDVIHAQLNLA
jgi:predicted regulator of Ras-like GTPase activity (Roadblock/LC7/MglB family)